MIEHGNRALVGRIITATHDRQLAVFGTLLAAGHRRIDKIGLAIPAGGIQLPSHGGAGGGVIYQQGAIAESFEHAARAQSDLAQVIVIAHANKHHGGTCSGLGGGVSGTAIEVPGPLVGAAGGAVVDGHGQPGFGQVAGHGIAHGAQPDKRGVNL